MLIHGYTAEVGRRPPRELAELMLAQHWLETGRDKSMYHFNWGNLSAGSSWEGDVWRPTWYEVGPDSSARDRRLHELMLEGKVPSAFRAYPSAEAGVRDYIALLRKPRFQPMLRAAATGDVQAFARAIHDTGYCPDCEPVSTSKTLSALRHDIRERGLFADLPSGGAPKKSDDFVGGLFARAALMLLSKQLLEEMRS